MVTRSSPGSSTQHFRFGARAGMLFLGVVFFGACGAVFLYVAETGGALRLFPSNVEVRGTPIYVFAAIAFSFVGLGIASSVANRMRGPRELVIGADAFEVPKNVWSAEIRRVERAQVQRFTAEDVMGTKSLSVFTSAGVVHVSNRVVGDDGYEALREWLQGR